MVNPGRLPRMHNHNFARLSEIGKRHVTGHEAWPIAELEPEKWLLAHLFDHETQDFQLLLILRYQNHLMTQENTSECTLNMCRMFRTRSILVIILERTIVGI